MARPAKSVKVKSGTITKAEEKTRGRVEEALRGEAVELIPSEQLTEAQKEIFVFVRDILEPSQILGRPDSYILEYTAITIDRLRTMEARINREPELLQDGSFMSARDKYSRDFFRCCNELCLSPQSRAKIAVNAAVNVKSEKKSLIDILNEDDGDE